MLKQLPSTSQALGEVDSAMRWSALTVVYEEYQSVKLGGVTINTQPPRV